MYICSERASIRVWIQFLVIIVPKSQNSAYYQIQPRALSEHKYTEGLNRTKSKLPWLNQMFCVL